MENTQSMLFGKTYPEHLVATKEKISSPSSKRSRKLPTPTFMFLDLRTGGGCANGRTLEVWLPTTYQLVGGQWMPNISAFPSDVGAYICALHTAEFPITIKETKLSEIIQSDAPQKYYLSARACQGILNRAKNRGKQLPPMLEEALMEVIALDSVENVAQKPEESATKNKSALHLGGGVVCNVVVKAVGIDQQGGKGMAACAEELSPTLCSDSHGTPHAVAYTLDPTSSNSMKSKNPHSGIHETDIARCLDTFTHDPSCNQGGNVIVYGGSFGSKTQEYNAFPTLRASGGDLGGGQ